MKISNQPTTHRKIHVYHLHAVLILFVVHKMIEHFALVNLVCLALRQIADQNVKVMVNVRRIALVLIKDVKILALELVVGTLNVQCKIIDPIVNVSTVMRVIRILVVTSSKVSTFFDLSSLKILLFFV